MPWLIEQIPRSNVSKQSSAGSRRIRDPLSTRASCLLPASTPNGLKIEKASSAISLQPSARTQTQQQIFLNAAAYDGHRTSYVYASSIRTFGNMSVESVILVLQQTSLPS